MIINLIDLAYHVVSIPLTFRQMGRARYEKRSITEPIMTVMGRSSVEGRGSEGGKEGIGVGCCSIII